MTAKTQKQKGNRKLIKKTIMGMIIFTFLIFAYSPLWAEDYPAYLGSERSDYLQKLQNGYNPEAFTKIDLRQQARVDKRNQVEGIITSSYQATPISANEILGLALLEKYNSDKLKVEIGLQGQQRIAVATAQTEFIYIPHSDGSKEFFTDGLVTRIANERVFDELGNVNLKNTYNMKYTDRRLLTSYEATLKDNLGNISRLSWYGARYTADSLFYAGKDTVANKNLLEYYFKETDSAGNTKLTHWQASNYEGKLLRTFSQTIKDSIYGNIKFTRSNISYTNNDPDQPSAYREEGIGTDGLDYNLDRTNITYNDDKNQLTGYDEVRSTFYPAPEDNPNQPLEYRTITTLTHAQFNYIGMPHQFGRDVDPEPDRLLESIITTTTETPNGSRRTDTITTTYKYEGYQLIGAQEHNEFNGQESKWWEYKDAQGNMLIRDESAGGITYYYIDPNTHAKVNVAEDQVIATLKDGYKFKGNSDTQFEILYRKPMAKQAHSLTSYYNPFDNAVIKTEDTTLTYTNGLVNNLQRMLNIKEYTEATYTRVDSQGRPQTEIRDIITTYIYAQNGNLLDAQGKGTGSGYELLTNNGWMEYKSDVEIDYSVILGLIKQEEYRETRDYANNVQREIIK